MNEPINKYFPYTEEIMQYYDLLTNQKLTDEANYLDIFYKLRNLCNQEYSIYNQMTFLDLWKYIENMQHNNNANINLKDIRIGYRLQAIYDRMRNYTIDCNKLCPTLNSNIKLSINDVIHSKIIFDTSKIITTKLQNLTYSNNSLITELLDLHLKNTIYKFSNYELSELILLSCYFNLELTPTINLSDIIKLSNNKITNLKEYLDNHCYQEIIPLIDSLLENEINQLDIFSIYDNLFAISHLENLLNYLSKDRLIALVNYYQNKFDNKKILSQNVKKLLNQKIIEQSSN